MFWKYINIVKPVRVVVTLGCYPVTERIVICNRSQDIATVHELRENLKHSLSHLVDKINQITASQHIFVLTLQNLEGSKIQVL